MCTNEKKKKIYYLKSLQYGGDPIDTCPICLIEMVDNIVRTSCNHTFHNECLEQWITQTQTCPYCRSHIDTDIHIPIIPFPIGVIYQIECNVGEYLHTVFTLTVRHNEHTAQIAEHVNDYVRINELDLPIISYMNIDLLLSNLIIIIISYQSQEFYHMFIQFFELSHAELNNLNKIIDTLANGVIAYNSNCNVIVRQLYY